MPNARFLEERLVFPQNLSHVLTEVAFHVGILSDLLDFFGFCLGFSIALICNVVRLLIRQWTIEAWPVKNSPKTSDVTADTLPFLPVARFPVSHFIVSIHVFASARSTIWRRCKIL